MDRCPWKVTEVVSGMAQGPDTLGEEWASARDLPVKQFPAHWNELGKRAGVVRNLEMAKHAEAAVVFWDGSSPGSKHMIDAALEHGLHLLVVRI